MADNSSFITGAAKGAFAEAMDGLPPWATEKTAFKIQSILQKNLSQQTKLLTDLVKSGGGGAKPMSAADAAKLDSELDKLVKNYKELNKEGNKELKRAKDKEAADKKALIGGKTFDNKWQKWQFALDSLAVVGKKVLDTDKQYLKTYDAMYKSGVNVLSGQNEFSDGFQALNHVVTQTGLRLETLQEVSAKYATSINAVGFMKFAKAAGSASKKLEDLGYSSKESAEIVGAYTDMQSQFTDMRKKSDKEIAAGAAEFGAAVRSNSVLMGKSQEAIIANAKTLSKSTDTFVSSLVLGEKATNRMNQTLMGIDPDFASQLSKSAALASQNMEFSSDNLVQKLALSGSEYTTQIDQLVKALGTELPEQIHKRLDAVVTDPGFAAKTARQALLASTGNAAAAENVKAMQAMKVMFDNTAESSKSQIDNANKTGSSVSKLDTQMEKLSASMQAAFSPTITQVDLLRGSIEKLNDVIYGVIKATNPEARSWGGVGLMAAGGAAGALTAYKGAKTVGNFFSSTKGAGAGIEGAGAGIEGAEVAAKGAGVAAKGGGKMLGKLLPGIGLAFGIYDAISRASKGDYTGAGLAGVSGIASLFPGLGTAVAVGIDAANIARDYNTPTASTINSPSAVPADPESVNNTSSTPATGAPRKPGIDKTPSGNDINSTLVSQTNLLQQILLASETNVSVSRDILKYARNRT